MAVMTRRDDKKDETRARLVSAGAAIFAEKGVDGARIGDIAKAAGVAMGTLYTHFPDKEALFDEVMRSGKEIVLAGLEFAQSAHDDREVRDLAAMEGVVAFAQMHGPLFRLLLSRGGGDNPVRREIITAITNIRIRELTRGLELGWARPDQDPEFTARCEVGAVFHLLDWWLDNKDRMPADALARRLSEVRRWGAEGRPDDNDRTS
jgi:AcrR family transcriptional regulator